MTAKDPHYSFISDMEKLSAHLNFLDSEHFMQLGCPILAVTSSMWPFAFKLK